MDPAFRTITDISAALHKGEATSAEITRLMLDRIAALDPGIGAYWAMAADRALAEAAAADALIAGGRTPGPLCGVPVAVKDIIETQGIATSCGTASLRNWVPERDATVVERLRAAGAVMLGKLATYEFAISTHPDMPRPRNPWNTGYWAGGSSNGSGAAVAAGLCYGAIGTDTGGSIRVPSSINGITGLKPSYGRVSLHGVYPLAESLDTVGPMARSAADCALIFAAIAGPDGRDATAVGPAWRDTPPLDLATLRIGIDPQWNAAAQAPICTALDRAVAVLTGAGASTRTLRMPDTPPLCAHWMSLMMAEAAHAHPDLKGERAALFGADLQNVVAAGRAMSAPDYVAADQARRQCRAAIDALLETVDVLALPVIPRTDIREAELTAAAAAVTSDVPTGILTLNALFNMSGHPSLVLPCGFSDTGLPIGLQLVGRHGADEMLLALGTAFQARTDWHTRHPACVPA